MITLRDARTDNDSPLARSGDSVSVTRKTALSTSRRPTRMVQFNVSFRNTVPQSRPGVGKGVGEAVECCAEVVGW